MIASPIEAVHIFAPFQTAAPIPVRECAESVGLPVYAKVLGKGISGMLCRDTNLGGRSGFVCYVDKMEPEVRQRFTAAHELGHFMLHRHLIGDSHVDDYLLRAAGLSNQQEVEANRFAAELLMPWHLIDQEMDKGHKSVEDLAARFKVSITAMSIRLGLPT